MAERWAPEETQKLIDLKQQGLSSGKISKLLPGRSRGSVIGKLHRLGMLVPRDSGYKEVVVNYKKMDIL